MARRCSAAALLLFALLGVLSLTSIAAADEAGSVGNRKLLAKKKTTRIAARPRAFSPAPAPAPAAGMNVAEQPRRQLLKDREPIGRSRVPGGAGFIAPEAAQAGGRGRGRAPAPAPAAGANVAEAPAPAPAAAQQQGMGMGGGMMGAQQQPQGGMMGAGGGMMGQQPQQQPQPQGGMMGAQQQQQQPQGMGMGGGAMGQQQQPQPQGGMMGQQQPQPQQQPQGMGGMMGQQQPQPQPQGMGMGMGGMRRLEQVRPLSRLPAYRTAPAPAPSAVVVPIEEGSAGGADVEDIEGGGGRKLAQMTRMGAADVQRGRGKIYRVAAAPAPAGALAEDLSELPLSPLGAPAGARRSLLQGNAPLRRPVLPAVVQQAQAVSERAPAPAPSRARGGDVAEAPAAA